MNLASLKNHPGLFSAIGTGLFVIFSGVATEGFAAQVLVTATAESATPFPFPNSASNTNGPAGVNAYSNSFPGDPVGQSSASFSGSSQNSVFAGSASATGISRASATYHREFSFTNSSAVAQTYSLNGLITQGGLNIVNSYIPLPTSYSGDAGFGWSISFDGNQVAYMKGSFSLSDAGPVSSGVVGTLNGGLSNVISTNDGFTWDATPFTTLLGTLNAGQIGNVSIDALVSANSNFSLSPDYSYAAGIRARFGDPSDLSSYSVTAEQVSAVPEPAEWLLLTAGLAVVARQARKAKSKRDASAKTTESSRYPSDSQTSS
jgi:hypothetical protein